MKLDVILPSKITKLEYENNKIKYSLKDNYIKDNDVFLFEQNSTVFCIYDIANSLKKFRSKSIFIFIFKPKHSSNYTVFVSNTINPYLVNLTGIVQMNDDNISFKIRSIFKLVDVIKTSLNITKSKVVVLSSGVSKEHLNNILVDYREDIIFENSNKILKNSSILVSNSLRLRRVFISLLLCLLPFYVNPILTDTFLPKLKSQLKSSYISNTNRIKKLENSIKIYEKDISNIDIKLNTIKNKPVYKSTKYNKK